jgi:preprotein translocase subunit SecA
VSGSVPSGTEVSVGPYTSSFDVSAVYDLGNMWMSFGDMFHNLVPDMAAGMGGVNVTGSVDFYLGMTWDLLYNRVLSPLADMCYQIGQAINEYGTKVEAAEISGLKQAEASDLAQGLAPFVGFLIGPIVGIAFDAIFSDLVATGLTAVGLSEWTVSVFSGVIEGAGVGVLTSVASDALSKEVANKIVGGGLPFTFSPAELGQDVGTGIFSGADPLLEGRDKPGPAPTPKEIPTPKVPDPMPGGAPKPDPKGLNPATSLGGGLDTPKLTNLTNHPVLPNGLNDGHLLNEKLPGAHDPQFVQEQHANVTADPAAPPAASPVAHDPAASHATSPVAHDLAAPPAASPVAHDLAAPPAASPVAHDLAASPALAPGEGRGHGTDPTAPAGGGPQPKPGPTPRPEQHGSAQEPTPASGTHRDDVPAGASKPVDQTTKDVAAVGGAALLPAAHKLIAPRTSGEDRVPPPADGSGKGSEPGGEPPDAQAPRDVPPAAAQGGPHEASSPSRVEPRPEQDDVVTGPPVGGPHGGGGPAGAPKAADRTTPPAGAPEGSGQDAARQPRAADEGAAAEGGGALAQGSHPDVLASAHAAEDIAGAVPPGGTDGRVMTGESPSAHDFGTPTGHGPHDGPAGTGAGKADEHGAVPPGSDGKAFTSASGFGERPSHLQTAPETGHTVWSRDLGSGDSVSRTVAAGHLDLGDGKVVDLPAGSTGGFSEGKLWHVTVPDGTVYHRTLDGRWSAPRVNRDDVLAIKTIEPITVRLVGGKEITFSAKSDLITDRNVNRDDAGNPLDGATRTADLTTGDGDRSARPSDLAAVEKENTHLTGIRGTGDDGHVHTVVFGKDGWTEVHVGETKYQAMQAAAGKRTDIAQDFLRLSGREDELSKLTPEGLTSLLRNPKSSDDDRFGAVYEILRRGRDGDGGLPPIKGKSVRWGQVAAARKLEEIIGKPELKKTPDDDMKAGEGKTLMFQLAAAVKALKVTRDGAGVIFLTSRDYLADDAQKVFSVFEGYGFKVIRVSQHVETPRPAEGEPTIYISTLHEHAFNMLNGFKQPPVRQLLDEQDENMFYVNQTFIKSNGPDTPASAEIKGQLEWDVKFVQGLDKLDFEHEDGAFQLNGSGIAKLKKALNVDHEPPADRIAGVEKAIFARYGLTKGTDYVVSSREDRVILIHRVTGKVSVDDGQGIGATRLMGGLHQLLEVMNGVTVREDAMDGSVNQLTLQDYFNHPSIKSVVGASGTNMGKQGHYAALRPSDGPREVYEVPTYYASRSREIDAIVASNREDKFHKIADIVIERSDKGLPTLVLPGDNRDVAGIADALKSKGFTKFTSADADWYVERNWEFKQARLDGAEAKSADEALGDVIRDAGEPGQVTISSMINRGADIPVGEEVLRRGGLGVITDHSPLSSDIDIQAIRRGGRNGDPSTYQYVVSTEDEIFTGSHNPNVPIAIYSYKQVLTGIREGGLDTRPGAETPHDRVDPAATNPAAHDPVETAAVTHDGDGTTGVTQDGVDTAGINHDGVDTAGVTSEGVDAVPAAGSLAAQQLKQAGKRILDLVPTLQAEAFHRQVTDGVFRLQAETFAKLRAGLPGEVQGTLASHTPSTLGTLAGETDQPGTLAHEVRQLVGELRGELTRQASSQLDGLATTEPVTVQREFAQLGEAITHWAREMGITPGQGGNRSTSPLSAEQRQQLADKALQVATAPRPSDTPRLTAFKSAAAAVRISGLEIRAAADRPGGPAAHLTVDRAKAELEKARAEQAARPDGNALASRVAVDGRSFRMTAAPGDGKKASSFKFGNPTEMRAGPRAGGGFFTTLYQSARLQGFGPLLAGKGITSARELRQAALDAYAGEMAVHGDPLDGPLHGLGAESLDYWMEDGARRATELARIARDEGFSEAIAAVINEARFDGTRLGALLPMITARGLGLPVTMVVSSAAGTDATTLGQQGDRQIFVAYDSEVRSWRTLVPEEIAPLPETTQAAAANEATRAAAKGMASIGSIRPASFGLVPGKPDPAMAGTGRALAELVDEVAGPGRTVDESRTAADCLVLLGRLAGRLYPREGEPFLPGGARPARTTDDLAAGLPGAGNKLAPGAEWRRVGSWDALAKAVMKAGAGSTGLVLWQRPGGTGHAFAVHSQDGKSVQWIELQAPVGRRLASGAPDYAAGSARAVVLHGTGRVKEDALPPARESASTGLALTDPPANRDYGAIGLEVETTDIRLEWDTRGGFPEHEMPTRGDELAWNDFLSVVVEQTSANTSPFLELVGNPLYAGPGDEGHSDPEEFFRSVERVLATADQSQPVPVPSLGGFWISDKGKHVSLRSVRPGRDPHIEIHPQFTVGVEADGLADFLHWIRENSSPADEVNDHALEDIDTALAFGDEAADLFVRQRSSQFGTGIPLAVAELLDSENVSALRGYAALVFTHAIATVRDAEHPGRFGPKDLLAVVSRHTAPQIRAALPRRVREFLDERADELTNLFVEYASEYGPKSIKDPLEVAFDLAPPTHAFGRVRDYLSGAFQEAHSVRILPIAFGVHSSFRLDTGRTAKRRSPLILLEWRRAKSYRVNELREEYLHLSRSVQAIFNRVDGRRNRLRLEGGDRGRLIQRLSGHPVVRDVDLLLRGIHSLNFLPSRGVDVKRVDLNRDWFLDIIEEMARRPGGTIDPARADRLAGELRRVLSRMNKGGRDVLGMLRDNPGLRSLQDAVMDWAAASRAARRLLITADSRVSDVVPDETILTAWTGQSATSFLDRRSDAVRRIDESVADLLAQREDSGRLLRVLAAIHAWRGTKDDLSSARRGPAVNLLEQRVLYELGALGERRAPAGAGRASAPGQEFFGRLAGMVNARLSSREPAMAGEDRTAPARAADARQVAEIYRNLAPADRSRGTDDDLAYQIALHIRAARRAGTAGRRVQPLVYMALLPDPWATTRHGLNRRLADALAAGDQKTATRLQGILKKLQLAAEKKLPEADFGPGPAESRAAGILREEPSASPVPAIMVTPPQEPHGGAHFGNDRITSADPGSIPGANHPSGSRRPRSVPEADAVSPERAQAINDAWLASSKLGFFYKRSPGVVAIDSALRRWISALSDAPGDLAVDEAGRRAVEAAVAQWRSGKSSSHRMHAADALQRALAGERQRIDEESGYTAAGELVGDLHASVRKAGVQGASHGLPGPDLFGLLEPVTVPPFLREGGTRSGMPFDYSRISADESVHFFRLLDMLRTPVAAEMDPRQWAVTPGTYSYSSTRSSLQWAPWPDVELLRSDTVEMPKLVQATWFGGTLRPTGPTQGAWERFRDAANDFGREATFVLFTDRPRAALAAVRDLDAPPRREPGWSDWYLAEWAKSAGIRLVNLFEVIAAFGGSRLLPFIQTELAKQTPRGYAAASDNARVFLHRFGGLYTDPDNVIVSLDWLSKAGNAETPETFAIEDTHDGGISNSVMAVVRNHPIVDLEEQTLVDHYRVTQPELINSFGHRYARTREEMRRNSILFRSGPAVLDRVIEAAGYTRDNVPRFADISARSDQTWLQSPANTGMPRRWTKQDTLVFTQKVIHSMVRSLYNRKGDLHLTHINDAVRTHADPELVWDAAFAFLSAREDLRPMLRSVTYSGSRGTESDEADPWTLIRGLLPPTASSLLRPSDQAVSLGSQNGWWLGERPVAALLTSQPGVERLPAGNGVVLTSPHLGAWVTRHVPSVDGWFTVAGAFDAAAGGVLLGADNAALSARELAAVLPRLPGWGELVAQWHEAGTGPRVVLLACGAAAPARSAAGGAAPEGGAASFARDLADAIGGTVLGAAADIVIEPGTSEVTLTEPMGWILHQRGRAPRSLDGTGLVEVLGRSGQSRAPGAPTAVSAVMVTPPQVPHKRAHFGNAQSARANQGNSQGRLRGPRFGRRLARTGGAGAVPSSHQPVELTPEQTEKIWVEAYIQLQQAGRDDNGMFQVAEAVKQVIIRKAGEGRTTSAQVDSFAELQSLVRDVLRDGPRAHPELSDLNSEPRSPDRVADYDSVIASDSEFGHTRRSDLGSEVELADLVDAVSRYAQTDALPARDNPVTPEAILDVYHQLLREGVVVSALSREKQAAALAGRLPGVMAAKRAAAVAKALPWLATLPAAVGRAGRVADAEGYPQEFTAQQWAATVALELRGQPAAAAQNRDPWEVLLAGAPRELVQWTQVTSVSAVRNLIGRQAPGTLGVVRWERQVPAGAGAEHQWLIAMNHPDPVIGTLVLDGGAGRETDGPEEERDMWFTVLPDARTVAEASTAPETVPATADPAEVIAPLDDGRPARVDTDPSLRNLVRASMPGRTLTDEEINQAHQAVATDLGYPLTNTEALRDRIVQVLAAGEISRRRGGAPEQDTSPKPGQGSGSRRDAAADEAAQRARVLTDALAEDEPQEEDEEQSVLKSLEEESRQLAMLLRSQEQDQDRVAAPVSQEQAQGLATVLIKRWTLEKEMGSAFQDRVASLTERILQKGIRPAIGWLVSRAEREGLVPPVQWLRAAVNIDLKRRGAGGQTLMTKRATRTALNDAVAASGIDPLGATLAQLSGEVVRMLTGNARGPVATGEAARIAELAAVVRAWSMRKGESLADQETGAQANEETAMVWVEPGLWPEMLEQLTNLVNAVASDSEWQFSVAEAVSMYKALLRAPLLGLPTVAANTIIRRFQEMRLAELVGTPPMEASEKLVRTWWPFHESDDSDWQLHDAVANIEKLWHVWPSAAIDHAVRIAESGLRVMPADLLVEMIQAERKRLGLPYQEVTELRVRETYDQLVTEGFVSAPSLDPEVASPDWQLLARRIMSALDPAARHAVVRQALPWLETFPAVVNQADGAVGAEERGALPSWVARAVLALRGKSVAGDDRDLWGTLLGHQYELRGSSVTTLSQTRTLIARQRPGTVGVVQLTRPVDGPSGVPEWLVAVHHENPDIGPLLLDVRAGREVDEPDDERQQIAFAVLPPYESALPAGAKQLPGGRGMLFTQTSVPGEIRGRVPSADGWYTVAAEFAPAGAKLLGADGRPLSASELAGMLPRLPGWHALLERWGTEQPQVILVMSGTTPDTAAAFAQELAEAVSGWVLAASVDALYQSTLMSDEVTLTEPTRWQLHRRAQGPRALAGNGLVKALDAVAGVRRAEAIDGALPWLKSLPVAVDGAVRAAGTEGYPTDFAAQWWAARAALGLRDRPVTDQKDKDPWEVLLGGASHNDVSWRKIHTLAEVRALIGQEIPGTLGVAHWEHKPGGGSMVEHQWVVAVRHGRIGPLVLDGGTGREASDLAGKRDIWFAVLPRAGAETVTPGPAQAAIGSELLAGISQHASRTVSQEPPGTDSHLQRAVLRRMQEAQRKSSRPDRRTAASQPSLPLPSAGSIGTPPQTSSDRKTETRKAPLRPTGQASQLQELVLTAISDQSGRLDPSDRSNVRDRLNPSGAEIRNLKAVLIAQGLIKGDDSLRRQAQVIAKELLKPRPVERTPEQGTALQQSIQVLGPKEDPGRPTWRQGDALATAYRGNHGGSPVLSFLGADQTTALMDGRAGWVQRGEMRTLAPGSDSSQPSVQEVFEKTYQVVIRNRVLLAETHDAGAVELENGANITGGGLAELLFRDAGFRQALPSLKSVVLLSDTGVPEPLALDFRNAIRGSAPSATVHFREVTEAAILAAVLDERVLYLPAGTADRRAEGQKVTLEQGEETRRLIRDAWAAVEGGLRSHPDVLDIRPIAAAANQHAQPRFVWRAVFLRMRVAGKAGKVRQVEDTWQVPTASSSGDDWDAPQRAKWEVYPVPLSALHAAGWERLVQDPINYKRRTVMVREEDDAVPDVVPGPLELAYGNNFGMRDAQQFLTVQEHLKLGHLVRYVAEESERRQEIGSGSESFPRLRVVDHEAPSNVANAWRKEELSWRETAAKMMAGMLAQLGLDSDLVGTLVPSAEDGHPVNAIPLARITVEEPREPARTNPMTYLTVQFPEGSTKLDPAAKSELKPFADEIARLAAQARNGQMAQVAIVGYDETSRNGIARAEAVRDFLVEQTGDSGRDIPMTVNNGNAKQEFREGMRAHQALVTLEARPLLVPRLNFREMLATAGDGATRNLVPLLDKLNEALGKENASDIKVALSYADHLGRQAAASFARAVDAEHPPQDTRMGLAAAPEDVLAASLIANRVANTLRRGIVLMVEGQLDINICPD